MFKVMSWSFIIIMAVVFLCGFIVAGVTGGLFFVSQTFMPVGIFCILLMFLER
jgi:hypothetical protein